MGGWRPCDAGLSVGILFYRELGAIHVSKFWSTVYLTLYQRHILHFSSIWHVESLHHIHASHNIHSRKSYHTLRCLKGFCHILPLSQTWTWLLGIIRPSPRGRGEGRMDWSPSRSSLSCLFTSSQSNTPRKRTFKIRSKCTITKTNMKLSLG